MSAPASEFLVCGPSAIGPELLLAENVALPRYYFDIDDEKLETRDQEGQEFASPEEMRRAAIAVLPDIARDELPDGNRRVFLVRVRDGSGAYILQARLTIEAEWMIEGMTRGDRDA